MTYDSRNHHRRSIRAKYYDYTTAGAYFVTICVQDRTNLLGEIRNAEVNLSPAGQMVQEIWLQLPAHYPGVALDEFIVMPNHVHGIIILTGNMIVGAAPRGCPNPENTTLGQPQGVAPTKPMPLSLPDLVHRFKSFSTAKYRQGVTTDSWPRFTGTLWQRNYYEHIIRNDAALDKIRDYITGNLWNWPNDKENPQHTGTDEFDMWLNSQ